MPVGDLAGRHHYCQQQSNARNEAGSVNQDTGLANSAESRRNIRADSNCDIPGRTIFRFETHFVAPVDRRSSLPDLINAAVDSRCQSSVQDGPSFIDEKTNQFKHKKAADALQTGDNRMRRLDHEGHGLSGRLHGHPYG